MTTWKRRTMIARAYGTSAFWLILLGLSIAVLAFCASTTSLICGSHPFGIAFTWVLEVTNVGCICLNLWFLHRKIEARRYLADPVNDWLDAGGDPPEEGPEEGLDRHPHPLTIFVRKPEGGQENRPT